MKPKDTRRKHYLWGFSASLIALFAWLLVSGPSISANKADAQENLSEDVAPTPPQASAQVQPEHAHSHEIPEELDFSSDTDFRQREHWYEPASVDAEGNYLERATPMQLDASCANRPELAHATLESAIQAELGLSLKQATPDDVLVEEIAQFWQHDGQYFQISGRWDKDIPASYRVNHFKSRTADFSSDVEHLQLPGDANGFTPPDVFDVLTLGRYIDDVLAQAQQRGASPGARLVHLLPSGGDETLDLKLNNGRVVSWMFGNGRCQLRTTGDAYCRCAAVSHPPHTENKEPYRVID